MKKQRLNKPILTFPLTKIFNKTIAMVLKHWSHDPKTWFLHITDLMLHDIVFHLQLDKKRERLCYKKSLNIGYLYLTV